MRQSYLNKLARIYDELEELKTQMDERAEAIEDRAMDKDRDMTDIEQEKYDELYACAEDIGNALDYLFEYAEI